MKKFIPLLFIFTVFNSQADFLDASKSYQEGNYKIAFNEMIILAKFGHQLSQKNVAVMLYKGEGVQKDATKAYAWSKLLSDTESNKNLSSLIANSFTKEQLKEAEQLAQEFQEKYAYQNSKVLLGPTIATTSSRNEYGSIISDSGEVIVSDKFYAPKYPLNLLKKGIQGWVDLTFNIYPDGSVRDIQVTKETPANTFASEAIKSVELSKYKFEKDGIEVKINEPRSHTQRIQFLISNAPTEFNTKQKKYIKDLIIKANAGNVDAQYAYASIYDTYLKRKGEISSEKINQWLFNAAQSGIHQAQFQLGKNIYYGQDCKVEKQKGMDWIMRAAQEGNADAEFMAYQMLTNNLIINQSNQSPFYWLDQSAKNGLAVAQLNYAKEIALLEQPTQEQKTRASEYLKSYSKKMHKTVQWHHINSLLRLKTDKSQKKALASINKAIKKAKSIGWDVNELNQQKELILASKN